MIGRADKVVADSRVTVNNEDLRTNSDRSMQSRENTEKHHYMFSLFSSSFGLVRLIKCLTHFSKL